MRRISTVLLAALVLLLAYLFLSWIVDGYSGGNIFPDNLEREGWEPPSTWADWRDIVIVLTGIFWLISAVIMAAVLAAVLWLVLRVRRLLDENVAPAVDSLKTSLDNVRGTAEFAGETVVSPLIRVYAVVRGVRAGVSALGNLPGSILGNKGKKSKKAPAVSRRQPPGNVVDELTDWARAVVLGVRQTAREALDRGREGAAQAYDEAWDRYDAKTKYRRRQREDDL